MTIQEIQAFVTAPYEDSVHEIKAAKPWTDRCFKAERLRDIAAMANSGGGLLLIGRDNPNFRTGTLAPQEQQTYDITAVAVDVRNYIAPIVAVRVHYLNAGPDLLVALDVPTITRAPAIMITDFGCEQHGTHFKPGDVYVRTPAAQTQRLASYPEMEDLLNRVVEYRLVQELQRFRTLGGA